MVKSSIPLSIPTREIQCDLVNQYFQWVLISRYKAGLSFLAGFNEIIRMHHNHEISYWEKEKKICDASENYLRNVGKERRLNIERNLVSEALSWFNKFTEPLGVRYECTSDGLQSTLK